MSAEQRLMRMKLDPKSDPITILEHLKKQETDSKDVKEIDDLIKRFKKLIKK